MNCPRFLSIFLSLAMSACFIGPSLMVVSDTATITLNNNVNPIEHTISDFAAGPYGWLEKIGMVAVAISFLLIGLNLLRVRDKREFRIFKLEGVLFIIVTFGFLMTSLFDNNLIGNTSSLHGLIHQSSLVAGAIFFYLSCLIFMRFMINIPGLRYFGIYSGLTFLIGFTVFLWIVFSYHFYHINKYLGLTERVLVGSSILWLVLVGPQVIKMAKERQ